MPRLWFPNNSLPKQIDNGSELFGSGLMFTFERKSYTRLTFARKFSRFAIFLKFTFFQLWTIFGETLFGWEPLQEVFKQSFNHPSSLLTTERDWPQVLGSFSLKVSNWNPLPVGEHSKSFLEVYRLAKLIHVKANWNQQPTNCPLRSESYSDSKSLRGERDCQSGTAISKMSFAHSLDI